MPAVYELEQEVRQLVEETETAQGTLHKTPTIYRAARRVIDSWARQTHYLEAVKPYAQKKGKSRYDLPFDFLEAKWVVDQSLVNSQRVKWIPITVYADFVKYETAGQIYRWTRWQNDFILHPSPSTASVITALSADLNRGDTVINLVNSAGLRQAEGYIEIGNETILYQNVSGNTVEVKRRGVNGTIVPITHSSAATVTELNIHFYHYRKGTPDIGARLDYSVGTISVSNDSDVVTGAATLWDTNFGAVQPNDFLAELLGPPPALNSEIIFDVGIAEFTELIIFYPLLLIPRVHATTKRAYLPYGVSHYHQSAVS